MALFVKVLDNEGYVNMDHAERVMWDQRGEHYTVYAMQEGKKYALVRGVPIALIDEAVRRLLKMDV